jgi:hypothetical protein
MSVQVQDGFCRTYNTATALQSFTSGFSTGYWVHHHQGYGMACVNGLMLAYEGNSLLIAVTPAGAYAERQRQRGRDLYA